MLLQQGDVLLERVKELPEGLMKKKDYILAEGETTGHAHKIDLSNVKAELIELYEARDGQLFVKAKSNFTVKHEEHKPITVKKGIYKVRRVKEYDHFQEESRNVQD